MPCAKHMDRSRLSPHIEDRPCRACVHWVRDALVRDSGGSVVRWYSDPDTAECNYGGTITIRSQASDAGTKLRELIGPMTPKRDVWRVQA